MTYIVLKAPLNSNQPFAVGVGTKKQAARTVDFIPGYRVLEAT